MHFPASLPRRLILILLPATLAGCGGGGTTQGASVDSFVPPSVIDSAAADSILSCQQITAELAAINAALASASPSTSADSDDIGARDIARLRERQEARQNLARIDGCKP